MESDADGSCLDTIIVGGGPAGLSAALILGRCRRAVLICDEGRPRNAASHALHGFVTRDGIPPLEFLRIARAELHQYGVRFETTAVTHAARVAGGFSVTLEDGRQRRARTLLIATGIVDELPEHPGFTEFYGKSIFVCPYCDGWEVRDQPLGVYARGEAGPTFAVGLLAWSRDVILFTDGPAAYGPDHEKRLQNAGIAVCEQPVTGFTGSEGRLEAVHLSDGSAIPRRALFVCLGQRQRSDLVVQLGLRVTNEDGVETGTRESTDVPGLFVAGDASRDVQLAIVAAAEGAQAAFAMHKVLGPRLDV
jgi:thioredoxin reductase